MKTKITELQRATRNGVPKKIFKVWRLVEPRDGRSSYWEFEGQYSAPAKVANKNLIAYTLEARTA